MGGNTTKIHMAVDAHGLPIDFEITGGEVHEQLEGVSNHSHQDSFLYHT